MVQQDEDFLLGDVVSLLKNESHDRFLSVISLRNDNSNDRGEVTYSTARAIGLLSSGLDAGPVLGGGHS